MSSSPGVRTRSLPLLALLLLGALFVAAVLVAGELRGERPAAGGPRCVAAPAGPSGQRQVLSPEQAANAALISAEAVERGVGTRAAVVALATAMQESQLVNIDYGDRDSVGLFQQRPSQGWGTVEQIMDPGYATAAFYDGLAGVDHRSMSVTEAAQAVQRSAYPDAYAQHERMARAFAGALTGDAEASLDCVLPPPAATGDPGSVAAALGDAFGPGLPAARTDGARLVVPAPEGPAGWAAAHWAVASAQRLGIAEVTHDGRTWVRADQRTGRSAPAPGWQDAAEVSAGNDDDAPPAADVVVVLASG